MKRKSTVAEKKFETYHDETPLWLVQKREGSLIQPQGPSGPASRSVTVELLFGRRVTRNGLHKIEGDVYHELRGPTAEASMHELCERLNRDSVPPTKMKKCVADGSRLPRDGGPKQMMLGELPRQRELI